MSSSRESSVGLKDSDGDDDDSYSLSTKDMLKSLLESDSEDEPISSRRDIQKNAGDNKSNGSGRTRKPVKYSENGDKDSDSEEPF